MRRETVKRYREFRTASGWVRWSRAECGETAGSLPTVRIERRETRLPRETADGSRYAVTFTVTGEHAGDYVTRCLPTARVTSREPGKVVAEWSY